MKKFSGWLLSFAVAALMLLVNIGSAAASSCLIAQYEPPVPQSLRR